MAELPKIISVDDHVVEPPHVWQEYLPQRFKADGPRVERRGVGAMKHIGGGTYEQEFTDDGRPADCWVFGDLVYIHKRHVAAVGYSRDEMTMTPMTYDEMRPGCYDPKARLEDQAVNHVEASLCFPTFPRFCGQAFTEHPDRDLGLACVQAYNDWMVEEWCGDSGGRLIPLTITHLWDADLAAAEVYRNAARGVRAVCFSEIPPYLGLPSIHGDYWEPFFRACAETGTTINMHIGSSSKMPSTSADAPAAVGSTLTFGNAMSSMTDWLFSGWLAKLPTLKIVYSEGQIGWIPYILERADKVWEDNRAWGGFGDKVPEPPSTYYYRQIYGCFFDDEYGLENIEKCGVDNICFETDYPHSDSTWPKSREVGQKLMGNLPEDVIYKLVRGNAIELLQLDFDK